PVDGGAEGEAAPRCGGERGGEAARPRCGAGGACPPGPHGACCPGSGPCPWVMLLPRGALVMRRDGAGSRVSGAVAGEVTGRCRSQAGSAARRKRKLSSRAESTYCGSGSGPQAAEPTPCSAEARGTQARPPARSAPRTVPARLPFSCGKTYGTWSSSSVALQRPKVVPPPVSG